MRSITRRLIAIVAALLLGVLLPPAAAQQPPPGPGKGAGNFWSLRGNGSTTPGTHFLGTTDDASLELRVDGERGLLLEPRSTPNVVGGHEANFTAVVKSSDAVVGATIGGGGVPGEPNRVTDDYGTVGGGFGNQAGNVNRVDALDDAMAATVGGGIGNTASGARSTIGGGFENTASGLDATIGGGFENTASDTSSTVSGGISNEATGLYAAIGGGANNVASGDQASIGGGLRNTASGTRAVIPGGVDNQATGEGSFAAGKNSDANHDGSFVWGDDSTPFAMASSGPNQFIARAAGGFYLQDDSSLDDQGGFLNTSTGAHLTQGGVWTNASDRALKAGFAAVDPQEVLAGVAELPVMRWHYRAEGPSVSHLGPTAQDFQAAFGLGADERAIGTVDADGVALAAIQGLNEVVEKKDARISDLEGRIERLEAAPAAGAVPASGFPWLALAPLVLLAGITLGALARRPTGLGI